MKAGKNYFVHQGKLQSNDNMLIQDKELGHKSYEPLKTLEPQIKNFFCGIIEKILSTGCLGAPTAGRRTRREHAVQICRSVLLQSPCGLLHFCSAGD